MLETLDYTIRIGSTPTFLYFDFYLYSAYAAHYVYLIDLAVLATLELHKRPGNSDVDKASWDCLRPLKQSHDPLSTSLLPGLLRNSEINYGEAPPPLLNLSPSTIMCLLEVVINMWFIGKY